MPDDDLLRAWRMGDSGYVASIMEEQANFQQARASGDAEGMASAGMKIAGYEQARERFSKLSIRELERNDPRGAAELKLANAVQSMTRAEHEAAKASRVSPEEYSKNKIRLQGMRERGEYPMPERN